MAHLVHKDYGNESYKKGRYDEAIGHYTLAIGSARADMFERDGDKILMMQLASYYANRAAAHEKLKHIDHAIKDCQEAITVDPMFVKSYLREARLFLQNGWFDRACVLYDQACRIKKEQSQRLRDQAYATRRKYLRAKAIAQRIRQDHVVVVERKDLLRALQDFHFVQKVCPEWIPVLVHKAETLVALGSRMREAHVLTGRVLELSSSDTLDNDFMLLRGKTLFNTGSMEEALRVLRNLPKASRLYRLFRSVSQKKEEADGAYKSRNLELAYSIYTEALSLMKDDDDDVQKDCCGAKAMLYYNRGSTQLRLDCYEQTVEDCTEAIRHDEWYVKAFVQRANARLCLKTGDRVENLRLAVLDYQQASRLASPDNHAGILKKLQKAETDLQRASRDLSPPPLCGGRSVGSTSPYSETRRSYHHHENMTTASGSVSSYSDFRSTGSLSDFQAI